MLNVLVIIPEALAELADHTEVVLGHASNLGSLPDAKFEHEGTRYIAINGGWTDAQISGVGDPRTLRDRMSEEEMPPGVDFLKVVQAQSVFRWSPGPALPEPSPDFILAIPTDDGRATLEAMGFVQVL